jgi:hypothetical protein
MHKESPIKPALWSVRAFTDREKAPAFFQGRSSNPCPKKKHDCDCAGNLAILIGRKKGVFEQVQRVIENCIRNVLAVRPMEHSLDDHLRQFTNVP